jgi:alcohol dehydrogenase
VDVARLTPAEAAEEAARAVERLVRDLGLPRSLEDIAVPRGDYSLIADAVMQDLVVAGSPRPVAHSDVVTILEAATRVAGSAGSR